MQTEVIVAVVALVGTVVGGFLNVRAANEAAKERYNSLENKLDALDEKFDIVREDLREDVLQLSERVNKHNNVITRVFKVEQSSKSAHHRIDDLKKELGK